MKYSRIHIYVHNTQSQRGRFGAMVEVGCDSVDLFLSADFEELIHDLAIHVSAANPKYIAPQDVPSNLIESERSRIAEGLEEKSLPPPMIQKIIQAKLDKQLFGQVCLLSQVFVNDSKFKGLVRDLIDMKSQKWADRIQVIRFVRFEVGRETSFNDRTP